jgi:glycosyltransferase involved in cell wall biosynthesis
MTAAPPILTVGLVVHNGAAHLASAIETLISQTFQLFELVIYDNASNDQTPSIAHRFASIDARIRIARHPRNIGVLSNFIAAAEAARTPLFCWAAHDDVRDPKFLERLVGLLDDNPKADLACCAVRNMDPDGTPRDLRLETTTLRSSTEMTSAQRLLMYLQEGPGTPMYGVFRTRALQQSLDVLREVVARQNESKTPLLGVDMVFLASFLGTHGLALTHEPLLLFRRGGLSHRVDLYASAGELLAQVLRFHRTLARAVHEPHHGFLDSIRLRMARWRYLARYLASAPMRRMFWHYLGSSRLLRWVHARWLVAMHPAFRRLKSRNRTLPRGSRVILFGGGKHTRRCHDAISAALAARSSIVAICDDAPAQCRLPGRIRIISPGELDSLDPDLIVVSSDAYEAKLFRRARQCAGDQTPVWCIYDIAIESSRCDRSAISTDSTNCSNSASESTSAPQLQDAGAAA